MASTDPGRRAAARTALLAIVLAAATAAAFGRAGGHGFVSYDDGVYIVDNPRVRAGLSGPGVVWAFTTTHGGNWHPLTWLSHMLDAQLFGLSPGGHHAVGILLHAASAALLFLFLQRATGALWRSALAAALFGVHPLRVESVAWAAERKDVLSGFFFAATLLAYLRYAAAPGRRRIAPVAIGLALGLMAKPTLVTFPLLLLLLDRWPLGRTGKAAPRYPGRCSWGALVLEKTPLFALAGASAAVTVLAQSRGGALGTLERFPLAARVANALQAPAVYLERTFWPRGFSVFYPFPEGDPAWGPAALSAVAMAILSAAVLLARRSAPHLTTGWFWYLLVLAPVSGLVQVGEQATADRYTYLPLAGIFIVVSWATVAIPMPRQLRLAPAAVAAIIAAAGATWVQTGHWRDDAALFSRAVQNTRGNWLAHSNLGAALLARGQPDAAAAHFTEALRIRPGYGEALNNLGIVHFSAGRFAEAAASFSKAARAYPSDPDPPYNLGLALARLGRLTEAEGAFRRSLELRPDALDPQIELSRIWPLLQREPGAAKVMEGVPRLQTAPQGKPENVQPTRTPR